MFVEYITVIFFWCGSISPMCVRFIIHTVYVLKLFSSDSFHEIDSIGLSWWSVHSLLQEYYDLIILLFKSFLHLLGCCLWLNVHYWLFDLYWGQCSSVKCFMLCTWAFVSQSQIYSNALNWLDVCCLVFL